MGGANRNRDPLSHLSYVPAMIELGRKGYRTAEQRIYEKTMRWRTNMAVSCIRACWNGDFSMALSMKEQWDNSWRTATKQSKQIVIIICERFHQFISIQKGHLKARALTHELWLVLKAMRMLHRDTAFLLHPRSFRGEQLVLQFWRRWRFLRLAHPSTQHGRVLLWGTSINTRAT